MYAMPPKIFSIAQTGNRNLKSVKCVKHSEYVYLYYIYAYKLPS